MARMKVTESERMDVLKERLELPRCFEICFQSGVKNATKTLQVPSLLAFRLSIRFREARDYLKDADSNKLPLSWIFGSAEKVRNFERKLQGGTLLALFTAFVNWLYSKQIFWIDNSYYFYDMWRLAEVLGAPALQNAALNALSKDQPWFRDHDDAECQMILHTAKILQDCWKDTNFTEDEHYGAILGVNVHETNTRRELLDDDTYWHGKKRLLFVLDLMAFHGIKYQENLKIIHKGGDLAVRLGFAMERIGFENMENYPLSPKNFHKYLVDETMPDYEDESISDSGTDDSADEDDDPSDSEGEVVPTTPHVMEDDAQYDEDGIPIEDRDNGSSALINNLKRVHPTGFFGDEEVEALVLGLPPAQRQRVMEEMAEDEM